MRLLKLKYLGYGHFSISRRTSKILTNHFRLPKPGREVNCSLKQVTTLFGNRLEKHVTITKSSEFWIKNISNSEFQLYVYTPVSEL